MKGLKDRQGNEIKRAYVLAGGQSRRMGQDKAFVKLNGVTLLEKTIHTCREVFELVTVSAKSPAKFEGLDCPVVSDWPGAEGPMAGIIASLEHCGQGSCFVTAVDFCDLSVNIIESLLKMYDNQHYFGLQENNRLQPLCGIYSTAIKEHLIQTARNGNYGMKEALMSCKVGYVPAPVELWRNINTPSDLPAGGSND